jgi:hypothetical protein
MSEQIARDKEEIAPEDMPVEDKETWETSDDEGSENNLLPESQSQEHSPNGSDDDSEPSDYSPTNDKRLYSERITNTPPASPPKKRNRVQATSSIRNALEIAGELTGSPKGLLRFWKKGSQAQMKEYWDRELETRRAAEDDEAHSITVKKSKSAANKREAAKLRKQRQRERAKEADIRAGVRSPGGTKRKVSAKSISNSRIT